MRKFFFENSKIFLCQKNANSLRVTLSRLFTFITKKCFKKINVSSQHQFSIIFLNAFKKIHAQEKISEKNFTFDFFFNKKKLGQKKGLQKEIRKKIRIF